MICLLSLTACRYFNNSHTTVSNNLLAENFGENKERDIEQQPQKVLEYIGNIKGQKIMDLGAGDGYFTFKLAIAGASIIAAEVNYEKIKIIKQKVDSLNLHDKIELRKVPYDSPNLQPNEIDKFFIVNTYHHIDNRSDYFKKVKAGLKKRGEAIIIDYFKRNRKTGLIIPNFVSPDEVVEELKAAGFSEFEVEKELLEFQYIVRAR